MSQKINLINPLFQSPYTYLQAAGSSGKDGSARGIHLRWDFLRQLGNEHLPKGNLSGSNGNYPSTQGFNKDNDFVRIYRVPYNKEFSVEVDFSNSPDSLTETGNDRIWHYDNFIPVSFDSNNTTDVFVRFMDIDEYDTIRSTVDPNSDPLDFLKAYTGIIEAGTSSKLKFKGVFELGVSDADNEPFGEFKVEAISLIHDNFDAQDAEDKYFISCRKRIARLDPLASRTFLCENIEFFRFSYSNFFPQKLTFSTYQDHIIGENGEGDNNGNFVHVGDFSLDDGESDNNDLVYKRLEDITKYLIDKRWPKYNDIDSGTKEFTVKVQNYKDKWEDPEGLKQAVETYLDLSKTDNQAIGYLPSDTPGNTASSEISYLDMLKLVSLDFHVARMLGLGHIDKSRGRAPGILDSGLDAQVLIDFINTPGNSSSQVRDYLVDKAPNSEPVLISAVNRSTPLSGGHLKDILNATPDLNDEVLLAAINRNPPLSSGIIEDVLIANSPLSDQVLLAAINRNPPLPAGKIKNIVEESYPLSDEVLLAIANRSVPLPAGIIKSIMEDNSPLTDEVLIALLTRSTPLPAGIIRKIFLENTPLSPIVEDTLLNRQPPLPNNVINAILNSSNIAGQFRRRDCIYVMEYITQVDIEGIIPRETATHLYMSLPTSFNDFRLPPAPELKQISYGLFINNATGNPTQLTDDDGYTPYADERFINLKRNRFLYENSFEDFFFSRIEFCICDESHTIGFGIEYKLDSESVFRSPEINHDSEFSDHAGTPETIFVPNNGAELVFNHQETEEGIHDYALYSINWFSRASEISNIQQTDFTKFKKRNSILPPFNFAVQLIQEEVPLIFTAQHEQDKLNALTTTDKTLVRATFDWNYNHNKAYQVADYAELFFRAGPPMAAKGKVVNVNQLPNNRVQVTTESYNINSSSPAQLVQPNIAPSEIGRFVGSSFVSGQQTFLVESVSSSGSGDNPTFILEQIRETEAVDFNQDNNFTVTESFVSPETGDMFLVIENLSEPSNWDATLVEKVYLEHFFKVINLNIQFSDNPQNDGTYTIDTLDVQGSDTIISLIEEIADDTITNPGEILFSKKVKVVSNDDVNKTFTVQGDVTSELAVGEVVLITASNTIDNSYTVINLTLSGSETVIEVNEPFTAVGHPFYLSFNKTVSIASLDANNNTITINGDLSDEIIPPYREEVINTNGNPEKVIVGGIFEEATIIEKEDVDDTGTAIPNSRTGVYEIEFTNYQLEDHVKESIDWYRGMVRILEDASFLPTPLDPNRTDPQMKSLEVWEIDNSGSTLKLTVYDSLVEVVANDPADPNYPDYTPTNEYVPIQTSGTINVNFHPSYRTYLTADTTGSNNFEEGTILPGLGEGTRQTFMGIRAKDIKESPIISSRITTPVILLAQEILEPLPPGVPTGPTFATRPDFYGKSTYTFDVEVNTTGGRQPHMLVFYRANERKILDQLYTPDKVAQILNELENLQSPDADFFTDRWNDLVNVNLDTSTGQFKEHTPGGFRFPIPNNDKYAIPQADITATPVFPFAGSNPPPPGQDAQTTEIVKQAIDGAFLPLTEQPVLYQYIQEGKQTRGTKPKIRDQQGQFLDPTDPGSGFDPVPMASKYDDAGDVYVRFTDYSLDGAAKNFYFYYGVELTNQLKVSGRSPVSGPIKLVNASPAEEPAIKKVTTQLANELLETPPAVNFEVNDYIKSEGIKKIDVYRTSNPSDSLSIRTMNLVKSVEIGETVLDDFENDPFPLFGDPLFYRIVAQRLIKNEDNQDELVPSKPSNVVLTNVVDNVNPEAPVLSFTSDPPTTSTPITLNNVALSWQPTCYNGTYYLYVMTSSGNWQKIYQIKSNDPTISVDLVDTDLQDGSIVKQDEDGNTIYKRFRVQVENSSGLLNLTENELTI
ncbi:MAG: hypothetical protein COA32_05840 [Fluviicola sp.]|nr:MAG: hypothetical protein COA32_05840 [Fluviicola sp.]